MRRTVRSSVLHVSLMLAIAIGIHAQGSKRRPAVPLERTQWKLIWLGGTKIEAGTPQQMPYLQLDPDNHRVSGSGGCNRLMGGYELEGTNLRFTQIAMTRMACLHAGGMETSFSRALNEVEGWKIVGQKLWLLDADHHVVAKFSAAPPES